VHNLTEATSYSIMRIGSRKTVYFCIQGLKEMATVTRYTFEQKESIGKCPCCETNVFNNQLYVEEDGNVYHLSCYNDKKKEAGES